MATWLIPIPVLKAPKIARVLGGLGKAAFTKKAVKAERVIAVRGQKYRIAVERHAAGRHSYLHFQIDNLGTPGVRNSGYNVFRQRIGY